MTSKDKRGGSRTGAGRKPAGFVDVYKLFDGMKKCKACGCLLPADSFYKSKSSKDGLVSVCRTCERSSYVSVKKLPKAKVEPVAKACRKCGVFKPPSEFTKSVARLDGLATRCRSCTSAYLETQRRKEGVKPFRQASDLVKELNVFVSRRQDSGTDFCALSLEAEYRKWSFCLDEYGRVLPQHVGTYTGFLQAVGRGTSSEYRVKKVRQERTNPLDRGVSVEKILFGRVRHRVRKFAKRYGVNYDERFATLGYPEILVGF